MSMPASITAWLRVEALDSAFVHTVLENMGEDWRASSRACEAIWPLINRAAAEREAGQLEAARHSIASVIHPIIERYPQLRDEESELHNEVLGGVAFLSDLLQATDDSALRERILLDVLAVYRWDVVEPGWGFGCDPAFAMLVEASTPAERARLLQEVRGWVSAQPSPERGDRRAGVVALAVALARPSASEEAPEGVGEPPFSPEDHEAMLEWAGQALPLVRARLARGWFEGALEVLTSGVGRLTAAAELLEAAGHGPAAAFAVAANPASLGRHEVALREWLARRGLRASAWEEAASELPHLLTSPTVGRWEGLWHAHTPPALRAALVASLAPLLADARVSSQPVRARALAACGRFDEALAVVAALPKASVRAASLAVAREAARQGQADIARPLFEEVYFAFGARLSPSKQAERAAIFDEILALEPDPPEGMAW